MAVDLSDRVDDLKAELQAPGQDLYASVTEESFVQYLLNGFWSAVLEGVLKGYAVDDDGLVTPTSGDVELSRELQQVVVIYSAYRILWLEMRSLKTQFKAVAGPVSYETQQSAAVLAELLKQLRDRLNIIIKRLGDLGSINVTVLDAVIERNNSMVIGEQWWVR